MYNTITDFSCEIEGVPVTIDFSDHARGRMRKRNVNKHAIIASIVDLGFMILDMKNDTEFAVINPEYDINVICGLHAHGTDVVIDVITVLHSSESYVKDGTEIVRVTDLLEA